MKKFKLIILLFILFLIPTFDAHAASANISITSSKSQVIVGETVTVTVKVGSSSSFTAWEFSLKHSSNLSFVGTGGLAVADTNINGTTSKSYTFKFKALSSGSAKVWVDHSIVADAKLGQFTVTNGSKSFSLLTQAQLEATYSKNNYLSSLSVEGYDLTPSFNKNTLEYNLEVENGTESAVINAKKEDNTATIKGIGEVNLNEGINTFEIKVTAQNGFIRVYKINITVKELDPIEVEVDGNIYNVIRKKELLPEANMYFQESTIMINEEEVPVYYNETSNITLIGLSNGGEAKLFIYDNGKYKSYDEISFNQLFIQILPMDENLLTEDYTISKLNIGDKSVAMYIKEGEPYPILYGLNIQTGTKNLYKYDKEENTLQRFELIEENNNEQLYFIIIISLFGFIVISYILFIIFLIKKSKKKKANKKENNKALI